MAKSVDNVLDLVRDNIKVLTPYSTARDDYKGKIGVFLDANESPYNNGYNRYPDPHQVELKKVLSKIKGAPTEEIFIGNGSDEAIDLCFRVFCTPGKDNAIAIAPSYGMYSVSAAINDIEMRNVQLNDDFSLPIENLLKAADANSKLLFLCSPNNPSGNIFPREEILQLAERFNGVVVVDEAYIDFSDEKSLIAEITNYPNIIVLQTLSKAYGMAALRLGMAFAAKEIISIFTQVKYPYNINLAGTELVLKMLQRDITNEIKEIVSERDRVVKGLQNANCVKKLYPSQANFLLVKVDDAKGLYNELVANQVIVRDRSKMKGCAECLRITIGRPEENDRMLEIVRMWNTN